MLIVPFCSSRKPIYNFCRIDWTSTLVIVLLAIMVSTVRLPMMSVHPPLAKMMQSVLWVLYPGSSEIGMQLRIVSLLH